MGLTLYTCDRCGNKWMPRSHQKPKLCPRCKSRKWDEKKKLLKS